MSLDPFPQEDTKVPSETLSASIGQEINEHQQVAMDNSFLACFRVSDPVGVGGGIDADNSIHCGLPTVCNLPFPSLPLVGHQDTITHSDQFPLCTTVVEFSLPILLSVDMSLSDSHGLLQVFSQRHHIVVIIANLWIFQDVFEENVNRQAWDSTKHKVKWGITCCFMYRAIVHKRQCLEVSGPITFSFRREGANHVPQRPVETLHTAVAHWMVWGGSGLPHTGDLQQFTDELTFKRGPLIGVDPLRKAIYAKVLVPELLRHLFGTLITAGEGLRQPSKMVRNHQHINRLVVRILCGPKVYAHDFERSRRFYTLQGCSSFWISSLADDASWAVTDIFFNVPVYVSPEETLTGQAQTPELPLMTSTVVNSLEDLGLKRVRDH